VGRAQENSSKQKLFSMYQKGRTSSKITQAQNNLLPSGSPLRFVDLRENKLPNLSSAF